MGMYVINLLHVTMHACRLFLYVATVSTIPHHAEVVLDDVWGSWKPSLS